MKKFCDLSWALQQVREYEKMYMQRMTRGHLLRLAEHAFWGGRKTKAHPLFELLVQLELIEVDRNELLSLNRRGQRILSGVPHRSYDLTEQQKLLLASWYVSVHPSQCDAWLSCFKPTPEGQYRVRRQEVPTHLQQWTEEMLYLGAVRQRDEWLELYPHYQWMRANLSSAPPMSEEELNSQLELQARLGREAEQYVLEYERERLHSLGLHDEAERVELISERYVNAGYDLLSFSCRSTHPNLYIEVKSVGPNLQYYWSRHEWEVAKALREQYALYLVERAGFGAPIVWRIENPSYRFSELGVVPEPVQYRVTLQPQFLR